MLALYSLVYLALPWFLFAVGWLWWPYAVLMSLALGTSLFRAARNTIRTTESNTLPRGTDLIFVLALAALLAWISGAGGFYTQEWDWIKHNAVMRDLVSHEWPVCYEGAPSNPGPAFLVYYIAYYLPAAAVGKLLGPTAANWALLAWTLLGLLLVSAWIARLVRQRSWLVFAGWFLLSGMDAIGAALGLGPQHPNLEWWAQVFQYSSNMALLLWVPQHALPGWIATALIMDSLERKSDPSGTVLVTALTGLWSPFVTIGLVPLLLAGLCRYKLRPFLGWSSLVAAPLLVVVAASYLGSVPLGDCAVPVGWSDQNREHSWFVQVFLAFVILEVWAFALLSWAHLRSNEEGVPGGTWNGVLLGTAMIVLTALPAFKVGIHNDLVMRASIPCLAIVWIVVLRTLQSQEFRLARARSSLLVLCLVLGAIAPLTICGGHIRASRIDARTQAADTIYSLGPTYAGQYLGDLHSVFYRHVAKTATASRARHDRLASTSPADNPTPTP